MMLKDLLALTTIAAFVLAAPARAQVFYDEAAVIDSQPIYEARLIPSQVQECGYEPAARPSPADPALLGDARATDPGTDLFGALQRDTQLREPPPDIYRCRVVTRTETKNELAGYQVRYEYGGQVHERRVAEHPGNTIRVSVQLSTTQSGVTRWR